MTRAPERVTSERWQVNLFATADDAERSARSMLRPNSPFWIFRTSDGLFDWSAISRPKVPWKVDAELVREGTTRPGERS